MSEHDDFFRKLRGELEREQVKRDAERRRIVDDEKRRLDTQREKQGAEEAYIAYLRERSVEMDGIAEAKLLLSMANEQLFGGVVGN